MSGEIEDGMGFSGLAPTAEDRRSDTYELTRNQIARARERQLAKAVAERDEMLALLKELIDIEGPQPGTSDWAEKVRTAIAKAEAKS